MAATRRAPPLQIFQDPVDAVDDFAALHGLPPPSQTAFIDATSPENMSFNPSYSIPSGLSPMKTRHHSSSPPAKALADKSNFNNVVFPPPPDFGLSTDSPLKRAPMFGHTMVDDLGFPTQQAHHHAQSYTSMYPRLDAAMDKENMHNPAVSAMKHQMNQHTAPPKKSSTLKRKMTAESVPLGSSLNNTNGSQQKKQKTEAQVVTLPPPEEMPTVEDDGSKPPYSYAQLIGMAILRAPNRRLTLASIYNWISTSFSFYQAGDAGWQNSIRHNLSLNKAFYKQERPKDDPGKGNYWAIVAGMEPQFMKEKARRNTLSSSDNNNNPSSSSFAYPNPNELPRPVTSSSNANFASESGYSRKMDRFVEEPELSSDATILAEDPAIHEGIDPPAETLMPPPTRTFRSSPPPVDIRSSPPPVPEREDTPPRIVRQAPSSRPSGGRKRKFGGLGDSGYYSSIESSATRNVRFLTSEVDREHPAMKRGRAEEEIMRMRSSSIDISPSKFGSTRPDATLSFASSSPFKPLDTTRTRGPLTPAVIFKKPARPPLSVSPGTNLKNHREHVRRLLGSPDKSSANVFENSPFKLPDMLDLPNPTFEIFTTDGGAETFPGAFDVFANDDFLGSSPLKEAKRPRLERAHTMAGDALSDVFGGRLASPFAERGLGRDEFRSKLLGSPAGLSIPTSNSSLNINSPAKRAQPRSHPANALMPSSNTSANQNQNPTQAGVQMHLPAINEEDDFLFSAIHLPSDDSENGLDISQGFRKIGAPPATAMTMTMMRGSPRKMPPGHVGANAAHAKGARRPGLGRSSTTMF